MYELLYTKLKEVIPLSAVEFDSCKKYFQPKKLRKRHFLLQEGEVCRYTAFVENGLLRSYTIDDKGNEHIMQFSREGWWSSDLYSFFSGEPSIYNIEALEDSELLLITKNNWDALLAELPVLERYFRILLQNNLIATQGRLLSSLSLTAEEKYAKFISSFPDCMNRLPQHMIASYLGITRETLSRIRKQIATRKL